MEYKGGCDGLWLQAGLRRGRSSSKMVESYNHSGEPSFCKLEVQS